MTELQIKRVALIATFAQRSPVGHLGRTALMKYFYFLQSLRDVPLGYRFTLYSYGPFDASVLADLSTAESLEVVKTSVVAYSGGYGYEIRPGRTAKTVQKQAASFLQKYDNDVSWILRQFGRLGSAELELTSTIVYVDREATSISESVRIRDLAERVRDVKPHFTVDQVVTFAQKLSAEKLLHSVR